jgi:predicted nuclease with TOPRIM domain
MHQQEQVQDRLASLKKEFETGQARLRQLEAEQSYLRETMLRISGAIQVLQEIMGETNQEKQTADAAPSAPANPQDHNGPPVS